ncbi:MAG: D-alanyl-D-alanine carboxypeptidase [Bdellovibrio sp.]
MISGIFVRKLILGVVGVSSIISTASAFSYKMNAMCFLQDSQGSSVNIFNPTPEEVKDSGSSYVRSTPTKVTEDDIQTKFRIASVSKVITSHWAIATLGPEYRFKTKISVSQTSQNKSCNVHFAGDMDPFMGKEMLSHVFTQLKPLLAQQNCLKINELTFDENFLVPFYSPRKLFIMQHREEPDFRGSDPNLSYGSKTTLKAFTYFVRNFSKIPVFEIKPSSGLTPYKLYSFQSRPLYMMMREYNAYSSNIPPNILFEKLGGAVAYKSFIQSRLGLEQDEIEMFNGSGYPVVLDDGNKVYNEISCAALVTVIQDLDHILRAYNSNNKTFQMADIMAVGGSGEVFSTFKDLYASSTFENTLVAKTGSADRSITFAGMLSTTMGHLYFAVLTEPDTYIPSQLMKPRTYIRDLVSILADRYTLKKFNYTQIGLMEPTDSAANLVEEGGPVLARSLIRSLTRRHLH